MIKTGTATDGFNYRLDTAEETNCDLEDRRNYSEYSLNRFKKKKRMKTQERIRDKEDTMMEFKIVK